jgi:8-oxo-dGTP pyrophosphatase MutT (NUDIX family)
MAARTLRYAAKALIIEAGRVLCLRKQGDIGGYYVLPGGGQDAGELLPDTLRRECREELGAGVEVGPLRFVQEYVGSNHLFKDTHGKMHFVNLYFACRLTEPVLTHPLSPDAGQVGLEWLAVDALDKAAFFPRVLAGRLAGLSDGGLADGLGGAAPVYLGDSV